MGPSIVNLFDENDLPIDRADTGHIFLVANALGEESITNFPGEHGGILALVIGNGVDDVGRGHFGFASANHTSLEAPRFIIPITEIDYYSCISSLRPRSYNHFLKTKKKKKGVISVQFAEADEGSCENCKRTVVDLQVEIV